MTFLVTSDTPLTPEDKASVLSGLNQAVDGFDFKINGAKYKASDIVAFLSDENNMVQSGRLIST